MTIKRFETGPRMSQAVLHGNTVYVAGQVAKGATVKEQTTTILKQIDTLLAAAGTDKTKILSATIWLVNVASFAEMNSVWDAWVSPGNTPARACVESKLVAPDYLVEIAVIAAV
jgi:enamine deaminase RidA (YjgF/YER057c/UK114 family)